MSIRDAVESIPVEKRECLMVKLLDLILKSKKADMLPSNLAREFLRLWQEGKLMSADGLDLLVNIAKMLEPEAAVKKLNELGFAELAKAIGGG